MNLTQRDKQFYKKKNCKYEIILHDDTSADLTQAVIKDYERRIPHVIKPIYQNENQKSNGDGIVTKTTSSPDESKFIAPC